MGKFAVSIEHSEAKSVSASGGFTPLTPHQGLCGVKKVGQHWFTVCADGKIGKLINIWQRYRKVQSGTFFEMQCRCGITKWFL